MELIKTTRHTKVSSYLLSVKAHCMLTFLYNFLKDPEFIVLTCILPELEDVLRPYLPMAINVGDKFTFSIAMNFQV